MEEYYSTSPRRETKAETTLLLAASSSSSSTSFSYYNPCHCFEAAIRSFLKCLGLGRSSAKEQDQEEVEIEVEVEVEEEKNNQSCTQDVDVDVDPPPTSADDETGKQKIEDVGVNNVVGRGMRRSKVRFPARPRIRPGRPGQINSTSPS